MNRSLKVLHYVPQSLLYHSGACLARLMLTVSCCTGVITYGPTVLQRTNLVLDDEYASRK